MKKYLIILLSLFLLSACAKTKPFRLTTNNLHLELEETINLPLDLHNISADDLDITASIEGIVNIEGLKITALQIGSTELTIKAQGYEETLLVVVSQITVHLYAYTNYLEVGKSTIIFMENFTDINDFYWQVSNPNIGNLNEFNVFLALNIGLTEITATKKDDPSINGVITIEVIPIKPVLYVASNLLEPGDEVQILIDSVYNSPYNSFNWQIENDKIVKIDENYRLKALQEGSTVVKITAKDNPLVTSEMTIQVAKQKTFTNEISEGPIFIKANNQTGIVQAGEQLAITIPGLIDPLKYRFHSLDATIVGITDHGIIWGIKEGIAKINVIAKSNSNIRGTLTVTVKGKPNVNYISRLINAGLQEEGYQAGPKKANKYGEWFEYPNEDWCAMFVSWCSNQAGIGIDVIPKYSSVAGGMLWFGERGLLKYKEDYQPKSGDIIFFASGGASHTGIVISCDGTRVYTIEGNTSSSVRQRNYLLSYYQITAYGTPDYPPFN